MILKLAEARVASLEFIVGSQVLSELEHVLREKAPYILGYLTALLDRCQVTVVSDVAPEILEQSRALVPHPGDARVLAEAWTAGVDFLVTLDRLHFLDNQKLRDKVLFEVGTPGDFIAWFRQR
jgi:predicted nucleic acid-binding protein